MRTFSATALAAMVTACGSVDRPTATTDAAVADAQPVDAAPPPPLQVRFLGVGGFSFRRGDDAILTAPLYSNPDLLTVGTGDVAPNPERVERFLDPAVVGPARAILVGHAHYDHLLDVPLVRPRTDDAVVIGNDSVRNVMAGVAEVPADRLIVVDDPAHPLVDRRMCPDPDPCTGVPAGAPGEWIAVPRTHVRVRALCSSHPPQILGGAHFGEGCVNEPQAAPPPHAADWREGATVAFLIDFLDPASGAPAFRVYYQDAPTTAPYGHVPADLLAERGVDLAVLTVGTFDAVRDQPGEILANLKPRYAIGGHWENFFRPQDQPIQPIPLMAAPTEFDRRANEALPGDDAPVLVDGAPQGGRYWRPLPGTSFELAPAR
jgi:L-ascorbate metabolism protein UlaG (beta-lactamase superfamily)